MNRTVCIDFDGTIVDHAYPMIGAPVPDAVAWMETFMKYNINIILWTMRSGPYLQQAAEYINDQGISLYGINTNPTQHEWTSSPKAEGNLYIDDAACGCPLIHPAGFNRPCVNWEIVGPLALQLLGYE